MKKRILSILLLCCMVLTLLPTTAFAAGKIWVGTEEELLAALADNTIGKITLTADITVSQTLVIDRQVVLVLDHSLKIDREQSSSGTLFHITKSGYLDTNAGSITDNVLNEGKFFPRQISGEVINEGEIIRGSFSGKVKNRGSINYGSFRGEVENAPGGKIANGELYGEVTNHGEIAGWKFYGKVTNDTDGLITSGEFYGEVVNNGRISYGKFYGDVVNNGTITGGSFFGTLTGGEIQDNAYIAVTFDSDGGSTVAAQRILRGQKAQRPAAPTKDGYTFIGWYNKADLQYINLPEWNFDYPVFENMELVAQWMEARPISTDPITYLDKDGNQQVCTAYTVLTSETKASILDYADKWYDLPAGWYVVEGNVTITPRLDTHGAVNLILTNGSHLTAEWGIDVKVGDTFTVYAQSTDEGTMGRLTACLPADFNLDRMVHYSVWPDSGMAGIGSSARWREGNDGIRESEGTIVINGGNIRAKGQDNASAIGGTRAEEIEFRSTDRGEVYNRRQGGSITINGGVVRTEAFAMSVGNCTTVESVGIGTCQMGYGGSVTINGGTVIAEATCDAITTGYGGTITINGGDVTAIGGVNNFAEDLNRVIPGNGIGPYESGSVTINDGTVKATAKGEGFGIGGARIYNTGAMTVTINGGTIEATANRNNAAIGDRGKGKSGVTITDGVIHATGKGGAAGIGSKDDIRITGGELTVSAEGSGAAIGGFTDSHSERVNCKSITINGNVIQSISSKDGACIGGAAGGSVGSITVSDAELPLLSSNKILIGWDADSPGGKLTIRNCRVASTDTLSVLTDGIRVGSNSELVIEESEIRLPHLRGIRVGGNGSIAVRDSDLHTYGIFMDETVHTITDAKTLKKLEITDSTVLTGDIIGARGEYASVEEIVIRGSSIRLNEEYPYNRCTIGGGEQASFGSIDIQDSQIDITSSLNAPIGSGLRSSTDRESRIRIANSQVSVRNLKFGPAIGSGYTSHGGRMDIIIENSTVTAKGGDLRSSTDYIPGIGKNASGCNTVIGIQILNSTVDSFRLREKGDTDYVYDDLHTQELPGIPAENISICGSTVNRKTIDHSFDEYGKCTLCGKYDLGYCYEHGLLTLEGLTDCVSDGSEKKLTGLSHQTGENETKQLAENTDYTAGYSNNVHPYTLAPEDEGFDPAKAPKVTLYGTGNYCGKAEHYFTISENTAAAPTITTSSLPDGKVGEAYSQTLTADGTTPITWNIIGGTLPESLTLNETTGKISGTPTAAGTASFTVKAENSAGSDTKELSITITKAAPAEFTISVKTDGNGTASASLAKAVANTEITLSATPNEGYRFKEWEVISGGVTIVEDKFIMPDSDVEVKAIFEEDAPPAPTDPAKPSISVTGTYTYNGSEHTANVSGYNPATMDIAGNTATDAGDYTVRVTSKTGRWADGSTGAVTAAWSIGKATQEAPNGLIGVAPTTEGSSDGKITGADTTMEYRAESETIYTACAGIEIENLPAGNYFVRYAEDHNHFASPDTVVTVGDGAQLADCTITFNAGGGSGSMEPVTVKARTNYILPECGFTAPADQQFKAWEIGGTEYKVGDSYTVLGDTEIKALWENSVITPTTYTVTVSNDGNGTGTAAPSTAVAGTEITLTAKPDEGYRFKEWEVISGGVTIKDDKFTMPSANVEVKAIFEKDAPPASTEFIVTFDGNGGTPSVSSMTTTDQKLTSLPSASRRGSYSFDGWYTEKSGGTKITTATVFSANTTVYAHWTYTGGGGGGYNPPVTYYTLRFETGGGSDIPSVRETYNTYIDLTKYVPTWRGHTFIGWYSERSLTNKVSSVYLTKDMTVYAGWRVDENPGTGANPFTDVSEKDWFYGDVMFVYENGLMLGTSKTLFSPHGTATRGMMATILWRMEGSPAPKGKNSFTDVEAGKWYADAITWTAENGIFAGYGKDKFGPDDPITREQLAAIFYRYADYKGYDLTVKGNLDKFKDADKITDYAETAMGWAVGSGLVKGKSGNLLDPQGTATRAEIAAMLHRFIEKYELVQGKAPGGLMGWIDPKRLQIPKTGDNSVLGLWGFSLCTSLAGCLALTTWQTRRRREEEALQIIEK
ncbi:MAG: InlB B-repeat-containing protein [Dysosmobacter welbionis]|uniref:InlB B-repeat-containing protein n=1 Tax=Dysosmobacter welbionis TaxID=2093857 RepID=UPI0039951827